MLYVDFFLCSSSSHVSFIDMGLKKVASNKSFYFPKNACDYMVCYVLFNCTKMGKLRSQR